MFKKTSRQFPLLSKKIVADTQCRMAIDFGRVEVVHAILQARPRMACLRLISFPNESAIKFVLRNTNKSKYAQTEC